MEAATFSLSHWFVHNLERDECVEMQKGCEAKRWFSWFHYYSVVYWLFFIAQPLGGIVSWLLAMMQSTSPRSLSHAAAWQLSPSKEFQGQGLHEEVWLPRVAYEVFMVWRLKSRKCWVTIGFALIMRCGIIWQWSSMVQWHFWPFGVSEPHVHPQWLRSSSWATLPKTRHSRAT